MDPTTWLYNLTNSADAAEDDTGRRILDAAHELFQEFGLRRTTLGAVARQAGVGRPTLYRRFSDKDAIIEAVMVRESRCLTAEVWSRVAGIDPPERMMVRAFVVGVRLVAEHPLARKLLESEPELILPHLTVRAGPVMDMGHAWIAPGARELQRLGYFPGLDIDYLLEVMQRLFVSVLLTPSSRLSARDEAQLERLASDCLLPLLTGQRDAN